MSTVYEYNSNDNWIDLIPSVMRLILDILASDNNNNDNESYW